jgi:TolA-binding protein
MIDRKIEINRNIIERFLMRVKNIVKANKKSILISLITILVALVLVISAVVITSNRERNEMNKFEKIVENYYSSDKEKEKLFQKTIDDLNALVDSSYTGYVNNYGYYVIAGLYLSSNKYSEGKTYLLKFVDKSPSNFFAPLALHRAGIACEKLNDINGAFTIFQRLEKDYKDSVLSDEMNYDLGRMYQTKGDILKAREYYNKVITESPVSAFAEKAKKRILLLGYNNDNTKKTM